MDRALHLVVVVLVAAILAGSSQASGLPNHLTASGTACRLLALPHRQWQALLDWQAEGIISSKSIIALIDTPNDPCRPIEPKARARKPGHN